MDTNPLKDMLDNAIVTVQDFAGLAEAPASITAKVLLDGYDLMITLRDWDETSLVTRMRVLLASLGSDITPAGKPAAAAAKARPVAQSFAEMPSDPAMTLNLFRCPKMQLERRPDGRFLLSLFKTLGGGQVSNYPEVKFVADRDNMWAMLEQVRHGLDVSELPLEREVAWTVTWKLGRETGKGGHYKDLVAISA